MRWPARVYWGTGGAIALGHCLYFFAQADNKPLWEGIRHRGCGAGDPMTVYMKAARHPRQHRPRH